jgi:glycosyl transferase family 25
MTVDQGEIPVFIINLDRDQARRDRILAQFSSLTGFRPILVIGIQGGLLPTSVCAALARDAAWATLKGTIGCFLSHVKAWEEVSGCERSFAIVVEDDTDISRLGLLKSFDIPADAEIIFLNDRMCGDIGQARDLRVLPMVDALTRLDKVHSGAGGDGYLLTRDAARKLLKAIETDGFYGHVDGRLLQYASSERDLAELLSGSWVVSVIRNHCHSHFRPKLGLLRGFSLSSALVTHLGETSSREEEDSRS